MQKLDKKQIPQFAALCVLSAGMFGYFVVKMVIPSPAAAGSRSIPPTATAPAASPAAATDGKSAASAPETAAGREAPIPTPGMRDPFVVGAVDQKTPPAVPAAPALPAAPAKPVRAAIPQVASIHEVAPAPVGAPALPFGLKSLSPLPAAPVLPSAPKKAAVPAPPAPPAWTVTGVLQNPEGQVAILRSGEARRIVRTGDYVDSTFRVISVTRSAVILRHDKTFYHLTLGTSAPAATKPAAALPPALPAPHPAFQSAPTTPDAELGQVIQAALMLARSYLAPAQAEVEFCLAAFHARRALPPRVAMRFLDGSGPATVAQDAHTHLIRGRDLYARGQRSEARAQWHQVLSMNDLDAADEAGKLLARFN